MIVLREKKFGLLSKILGIISPSAWLGKEAAKFASNSKSEYKKKRWKYALKGLLGGQLNAFAQFKKARGLYDSGADASTIEDYLNDPVFGYGTGIAERVLTHGTPTGILVEGAGKLANAGLGLTAALTGHRKKFNEDNQ